ncbi:MAG: PDZ domain-containing protein [Planctomycetota bacterium]
MEPGPDERPIPAVPPREQGWLPLLAGAALIAVAAVGVNAYRSRVPAPSPTVAPTKATPPPTGTRRLLAFLKVEEGFLVVDQVIEGGAAALAGLRPGERILAVDGQKIAPEDKNPTAAAKPIFDRLAALRPGEGISLTIQRKQGEGWAEPVTVSVGFESSAGELPLARQLLQQGVAQLVSLRRADGLWPHYHATERPSTAVSALVAYALRRAGPELDDAQRALLDELLDQLVRLCGEDGGLEDKAHLVQHRVYGSALLLLALQGPDGKPAARHAAAAKDLVAWLAAQQVQESSQPAGFDPVDSRYGGWSYYDGHRSDGLRTDVSVARFALVALDAGGLPGDAPTWRRADLFLDATQNFAALTAPQDPLRAAEEQKRDGGFSFTPRMSKAGSDELGGSLAIGRSYGSATADGLLGLLATRGLDRRGARDDALPDDPSVQAALRWLARSYTVDEDPGFKPDPIGWGQGLYYYFAAAQAEALHRSGVWVVSDAGRAHRWAAELVQALGARHGERKRRFGSDSALMHEDRPSISTSFALIALAAARDRLALGGGATLRDDAPPRGPSRFQEPPRAAQDALARGRQSFETICVSCHGAGQGSARNGPLLDDLELRYLSAYPYPEARRRLRAWMLDPTQAKPLLGWSEANGRPTMSIKVPESMVDDLVTYLLDR